CRLGAILADHPDWMFVLPSLVRAMQPETATEFQSMWRPREMQAAFAARDAGASISNNFHPL
ncbi:MAG: hypothetical protein J0J15_23190, partial [Mesorhizobium sp.]|nr:hypothetical protein [Mesorhizobium sp.]